MPTNIAGDQARLFSYHMVHYIVHGGPNDPVTATSSSGATTQGGYLSYNSQVAVPSPAGSLTPPTQQIPRIQQLKSIATAFLTATTANTGGIYLGTIPQGAWIESIEVYQYAQLTATGGTIEGFGIYWCTAAAFYTGNAPGYQPQVMYMLAGASGTGAASTMYSTEVAYLTMAGAAASSALTNIGDRNAFTTIIGLGPGDATITASTQTATADIDLYFLVLYSAAAATPLTGGSFAARIKFTGLEG